jgi:hypothetical protein
MYAYVLETGRGLFEGVCAHLAMLPPIPATHPHPATRKNRTLPMGLRFEVDHALRYRERRFSLG